MKVTDFDHVDQLSSTFGLQGRVFFSGTFIGALPSARLKPFASGINKW
jgi:hypothetical protein